MDGKLLRKHQGSGGFWLNQFDRIPAEIRPACSDTKNGGKELRPDIEGGQIPKWGPLATPGWYRPDKDRHWSLELGKKESLYQQWCIQYSSLNGIQWNTTGCRETGLGRWHFIQMEHLLLIKRVKFK